MKAIILILIFSSIGNAWETYQPQVYIPAQPVIYQPPQPVYIDANGQVVTNPTSPYTD